MKKKYSFAKTERERRYPILTALDLAFHHLLAAGIVVFFLTIGFKMMNYQSHQMTAQVLGFATRVLGLGID